MIRCDYGDNTLSTQTTQIPNMSTNSTTIPATGENKRQLNFEILRIIAMCMIIIMHYIVKGIDTPKLSVDMSLSNMIWWLLYAFSVGAVNIYVLISGYFLADSKWHLDKVFSLYLTVWVYSAFVPLTLGALGKLDLGSLSLGDWQQILLPIEYEHYWFATAYVMMYVLTPVLAIAVRSLSREILRSVITGLVFLFSLLKSVNPYLIPWDKYGNDVLWFIVLFMIAGYIRRFGVPGNISVKARLMTYVLVSVLIFIAELVLAFIVRRTGKMEYMLDMLCANNHILALTSSVALFTAFIGIRANGFGKKTEKIILLFSSSTFGIYLLHENLFVRNSWASLLGVDRLDNTALKLLFLIISIIVLFMVGTVVDRVRAGIFKLFGKKIVRGTKGE